MTFSSPIFLFAFLPIVFLLYHLARKMQVKNTILMIASLVFYSFGRLDWLLLMLLSVFCNYIAGRCMKKPYAKVALIAAVTVNVGILCVFKYLNFFTHSLGLFTGIPQTHIALPIGISFFTFQGMSYVIDSYRNPEESTTSFTKLLLYISFFPQLIAGPIVKYSDISMQIDQRETSAEKTAAGIRRFVIGLAKKLFLANTMGYIVDHIYSLSANQIDAKVAWIAAILYALQIYYDFSGYSDMAIGLGKMFGFTICENFRYPYSASSVKDFWRRWHISLSSWFRDYLYIPLGGNRRGKWKTYRNKIIVFFLTGMWHGANFTFILWGLWHGVFLILEDHMTIKERYRVLGRIYTFFVVVLGFVLFRAESLSQAGVMLSTMFVRWSGTAESALLLHNLLTVKVGIFFLLGVLFAFPVKNVMFNKIKHMIPEWGIQIAITVLLVLCILNLATDSFNPFIYTQF